MRFTGGENLTGFKRLVNDVFMKNELKNGEGAYEISHAKAGRSGYSFGPVQWDLLQNHEIKKNELYARDLFTDILTNSRDANNNLIFNNNATIQKILEEVSKTNGNISSHRLINRDP